MPVFPQSLPCFIRKNVWDVAVGRLQQESRSLNIISTKVYSSYLAIALILGGLLNFVTQYLISKETNLGKVIAQSVVLIGWIEQHPFVTRVENFR